MSQWAPSECPCLDAKRVPSTTTCDIEVPAERISGALYLAPFRFIDSESASWHPLRLLSKLSDIAVSQARHLAQLAHEAPEERGVHNPRILSDGAFWNPSTASGNATKPPCWACQLQPKSQPEVGDAVLQLRYLEAAPAGQFDHRGKDATLASPTSVR